MCRMRACYFCHGFDLSTGRVLWSRVVWENCWSLRFKLCGGRGVCGSSRHGGLCGARVRACRAWWGAKAGAEARWSGCSMQKSFRTFFSAPFFPHLFFLHPHPIPHLHPRDAYACQRRAHSHAAHLIDIPLVFLNTQLKAKSPLRAAFEVSIGVYCQRSDGACLQARRCHAVLRL